MRFFFNSVPAVLLLASATYTLAAEPGVTLPNAKPSQKARVVEGYGKLPLSFEPNQGQADPQVRFLSRGDGYGLSLKPSEAVLSLYGRDCSGSLAMKAREPMKQSQPCVESANSELRMELLGSNPNTQIRGEAELPGKSNYFVGKDPSSWHTNVANYRRVQYQDVYPGIDLVYYGNQRQLEHDFIVAPGTDPRVIRLNFTGASEISIDATGDLVLATDKGNLLLKRPQIYQQIGELRKPVAGRYVRGKSNEIGFEIGTYDKNNELVIDPVLVYSTYFPGTVGDAVTDIAVDTAGNLYVLESHFFPISTTQATVRKLTADGSAVLYSFVLDNATASAIAVDAQGNAYLTGSAGLNFPVVNAYQPAPIDRYDAFVTKIDPSGTNLVFSTYFGGYETYANDIAVDALGSVYITGRAIEHLPVTSPLSVGTQGAFVTKFAPSGRSLEYSSYIDGSISKYGYGGGAGQAIAVDPAGEAILTGLTESSDFPLVNALYPNCGKLYGACYSIFVTKINAAGTGLLYSTFLGAGSSYDVATNAAGDAFVIGEAFPSGFPIVNALYPTTTKPYTMFATRINPSGSALVYSTFLGDSVTTEGGSIAVDQEDAYVAGATTDGLPIADAIQGTFGGGQNDAFLMKINGNGSHLTFSTYLGGDSYDVAHRVRTDLYGNVYVAGDTASQNFPLKNPLVGHYDENSRAVTSFITKISSDSPKQFSVTDTVDKTVVSPGGDLNYTIAVTNIGADTASGLLAVTSVRDRFRTCTVSNGDPCRFVVLGGRASVNISSLAKGETRTIAIYATAAKSAGDYNLIPNTATLSTGAPLNATYSASATTTVRETADIAVASSLVDSTNGLLHYIHTVTNLGPDNSHAVLFLSPLPAHTTFVSASTTAGQCSFKPTIGTYGSVRCPLNNPNANSLVKVDITIQASRDACPAITDTASVISQSIDGNSANDSSAVVAPLPTSFCAK